MRVVILDTSNPDEMTGGQSVFIRNLIPCLKVDVKVVGTTSGSEALGKWQRRSLRGVAYDFMPVARMPPPGRAPFVPLRLTSCLGVAIFRRRILRAGDVMYVHSPEMGLPLGVGPHRKPIVTHLHGAANPLTVSRYTWARTATLRYLYRALQRRVINASALVLSVDEKGLQLAKTSLSVDSHTRLALMPICVDTSLFHPGDKASARSKLGLPPLTPLLLFVGRLEQAKGTERLVEAFAELAARRDSLSLALIGDGSQRSAMIDQARRAGVEHRVLFAGWVDHDSLPSWFQAADALLLPSEYEGLPTAVVEALACATPVVATAVGGLPGLIKEGENGLLLNVRTPEALVAATERALDQRWSARELTASVSQHSSDYIGALVNKLLCETALCV